MNSQSVKPHYVPLLFQKFCKTSSISYANHFLQTFVRMLLGSQMSVILRSPDKMSSHPPLSVSEGNKTGPFPTPPQTPDLDMSPMSPMTTPPPFLTWSTQAKLRKHRSKPNYNSQKHLGPHGWRLPGRQVGLLHCLLCLPGERLPALQTQGLHPEQGVSGFTFYPEPEPQACLFWYTEDNTPQALSQNLLPICHHQPPPGSLWR